MGDNPFRDPEGDNSTSAPHRARYGGLAPIVQDMGNNNRTRDPYFNQGPEKPDSSKSRYSNPFDEPGRANGASSGGPVPGRGRATPDLRPDDDKVKFKPKTPHDWKDAQPTNGFGNSGPTSVANSELEQAYGSQAVNLLKARDRQTGSISALGIISGVGTGLVAEPLAKSIHVGIDKLMSPGEGTARYKVGDWLSRNYTKLGSLSAEIASEEGKLRDARSGFEQVAKLDEDVLGKLKSGVNESAWTPEERAHKAGLMQKFGLKEDAKVIDLLEQRAFAFNPDKDAQLLLKIQKKMSLSPVEQRYLFNLSQTHQMRPWLANIVKMDASVLDKLNRGIDRAEWTPEERAHRNALVQELKAKDDTAIVDFLKQRSAVLNPEKDHLLLEKMEQNLPLTYSEREELRQKFQQYRLSPKDVRVTHSEALEDGTLERILKNQIKEREAIAGPELVNRDPREVMNNIKSAETAFDKKLFSDAERTLLDRQMIATTQIEKLEQSRAAAFLEGTGKWYSKKSAEYAWRGAKNVVGTGLALAADHYVRDYALGTNAPSFEVSSLSIPVSMSLIEGKTKWGQLGAKVTAAGIGSAIGFGVDYLGTSLARETGISSLDPKEWTEWTRPLRDYTVADGIAQGIAFALPVPSESKMARALLVGGATVVGKVVDGTLLGPTTGNIQDKAQDAVDADKKQRSYSSMENAVDKLKELGARNEVVLQSTIANLQIESQKNWNAVDAKGRPMMGPGDKLNAHRAMVATARAYGEYRLEHGTRLSPKVVDRPTYILDSTKQPDGSDKPLKLDLGGEALWYLKLADQSVKYARQSTESLLKRDEQVAGKKVTKDELDGLDAESVKINASINAIFGKHDITGAYESLKKFREKGETSNGATFQNELAFRKTLEEGIDKMMARNWNSLNNADGTRNPEGAKFIAKLLRDQALVGMAWTGYVLDHDGDIEGAAKKMWGTNEGRGEQLPGLYDKSGQPVPKGYDGVIEELQMAEELDPKNPDIAELWALCGRLAEKVQAKAPDQEKYDILMTRIKRIPGGG